MAPQRHRKKPVEVEAMQWDGTDERGDELYEFTIREVAGFAGGRAHVTQFMVLGEDDAYEVFNAYDEDMEPIPGNEIERRMAEGYTAVIYVGKSGQWANLRTGDWVLKETDGSGFYPCVADIFAETYEAVES